MSFAALAWASKYRADSAAVKLVLLAYADRHNEETGCAYPSIAWLSDFASLNRKTVITAVTKLEAAGILEDTGKRQGDTKQIKVYRLNFETVPQTEQFQKRNSTENSGKESQKRDTEPVREPIPPTDPIGSASPKGDELPLGDDDDREEPAPAGQRKRARGVRIDPEWKAPPIDTLPPDLHAVVKTWADGEYQRQAAKFLNHWLASSGRNAAKRDWARTWYNWLYETEERGGTKRAAPGAGNASRRGPLPSVPREGEGELSEKIRVRITKRLGKVAYQQWIGPAAIIVTPANTVEVRCPSEFHAAHLERNHEVEILRACRESIGERFGGIRFIAWRTN